MQNQILITLFLISFQLYAQCAEDECGPHPGMPNYLCPDGVTIAGPGDCIHNAAGQCYWEIITCPIATGYLRSIEASFCMDECSQYSIETEIDPGFGSINVIPESSILEIDLYIDRFVDVNLGPQITCVECGAFEIEQISLSDDCQYPIDCFQNPCLVESCTAYPNADCVPNYCGGCFADFYTSNGELITGCDSMEECVDLTGLFFGWCDMALGVGYADGSCQYISGCGWDVDGIDYSGAFFESMDECELNCSISVEECLDLSDIDFGVCAMYLGVAVVDQECQGLSGCGWIIDGVDYSDAFFESMDECEAACGYGDTTCDEITDDYESLHNDQYAACEFDNDCVAVWGHCDVGLGGCHYSVNEESYPEDEIDGLVEIWIEEDCMQWVCDCSAEPYAQCVDGTCTSAYCMSENPAGCFQTGCDEGYECIVDESECVPSWCDCDGFYGEWFCTEDCGGGSCVAAGLLGDLDGDGQINVVDIVVAVNLILIDQYDIMGDMNGDGMLNVVDIVMIVNIILSS